MSKVYVVNPYVIDFKAVELTADKLEELKAVLAKGAEVPGAVITETTLISGDVITHIVSPDNVRRPRFGFFNSAEAPNPDTGFKAEDAEFLGFQGMGLLTGPKQEDGAYADVIHSEDWYERRFGFQPPQDNVAALIAQLLGSGGLDTSAIREAAEGVDRDDITDEQLIECGCNGCVEELQKRKLVEGAANGNKPLPKAANGSTLQ